MASKPEIATCFIHGIKPKADTFKVQITNNQDPKKKDAKKWISNDLKQGSSVKYVESNELQKWQLKRDDTSALWSFHIKSCRDKLYVSYNTKGEVSMQKAFESKKKVEKREFERYFRLFLEKDGGVTLTSRYSYKILLCVQNGVLVMSNGTKPIQDSDIPSPCVTEETEVELAPSGTESGSQGSDIGYIVEVSDPVVSGKKWSVVDPIVGHNVEVTDGTNQKWMASIDGSGNWTFQPDGFDYYASRAGDDVKFETIGNDFSQFSVSPKPGSVGVYIGGGTPQKFVGKSVGKNSDFLVLKDEKNHAIDWDLSVLHFVFKPKPGHPEFMVIFPTPTIQPARSKKMFSSGYLA